MSNKPPRKPLESTQSVPFDVRHEQAALDSADAKPQMLVIDAQEETCRSLADHFRAKGWAVHSGTTTQAAIDIAIDRQPEVIVVDLFLPNVNAPHLVRALRGAVEHDVRMIGLATTSAVMLERARQAAVDLVLPKPIDLTAIDAFLAATKAR